MLKRLRVLAWRLHPGRVHGFLQSLPPGALVLDVGCGNDSAQRLKRTRPDIHYVGLDVGDYHQSETSKGLMDEYVVVPPSDFAAAIAGMPGRFDAVVSSHNIEHCDDPPAVVDAMTKALKPDGRLYMAFPSAKSVTFPSRRGTLNYYDDPTHRAVPDFSKIVAALQAAGLEIERKHAQYRPLPLYLAGALYEPVSARRRSIDSLGASWSYWGFESIIWARRPA